MSIPRNYRAALALTVALTATASGASAQVRQTQSGAVQGMTVGNVAQFLDIPFAAPPVGALRWRPPSPPAKWQGTRLATQYGPGCPQYMDPFPSSEDCLQLNVYTPASAAPGSNLPVMFWIYGGAFISGWASMYDPSTLVSSGNVVAVTANYRIGYLGFLAHPALSAADPNHVSGNYGLLDQQYALAWVRRNIANFGGNPKQITVFGESAGGQSVLAQLIMPNTVPLRAAISESGAYQTNYPMLAAAEAAGEQVATSLGCSNQTLSCLQALPADTLANAIDPLTTRGAVGPVVDVINVPSGPAVAFYNGKFQKVPMIAGSNHDEMRLFVGIDRWLGTPPLTATGYVANVRAAYGANADDVLNQYPLSNYSEPDYAWAAVQTDTTFACNTHLLNAQISRYTSVYEYELNDPNAPVPDGPDIPGFSYGSPHSAELSNLFPTLFAPILRSAPPPMSPAQLQLADTVRRSWVSLARYGRPLAPRSVLWPAFNNADPEVLSLVPPGTTVETQFVADHRCDFWAPQLLSQAGLPANSPY